MYWMRTPAGTFWLVSLAGISALAITAYFAKAKSIKELSNALGIGTRPNAFGILGASAGVGLGILGVYAARRGFVPDSAVTRALRYYDADARSYLVALLLIGPVAEEIVMRGYLYQAFRGSYGVAASIVWTLGIAAVTHFDVIAGSSITLFLLMILNGILCILRERTSSLWNCILCHLAYNATLICA
jgi:membrane protease YdiL (CAAX protease family)